MPVCRTCGEGDFDLVDGHYYCSLCQTQSQDLREEEGEEYATGRSYNLAIHPEKKAESSREKKVVDKGRPWTTHEGFQIILQHQVTALIALGADPKLEETVFRIWARFLQKTGAAFSDGKQTTLLYPYLRDRFPGTIENPSIRGIRWLRTSLKNKTHHMNRKKVQRAKDNAEYQAAFEGEEFEEEEMAEADNADCDNEEDKVREKLVEELMADEQVFKREIEVIEQDEEGDLKIKKEMVDSKTQQEKCKQGHRQVERFNLVRTLAVNMLGLLYCNPLTTTADLARWVRTGSLPYRTAVNALPSDMKLSGYDNTLFTTTSFILPSAERISLETETLARYLSLDHLPATDLGQLASRYISELRLPGELHGLVRKLVSLQPQQRPLVASQGCHLPNYSSMAMSYLVVILKLLLGLDDNTERELSSYARNLMQMIPNGPVLFVWEDWVSYMEQKMAVLREQQFGDKLDDIRRITDVEACMSYFHSKRNRIMSRRQSKADRVRERIDYREKLAQPFDILLERMKTREKASTSVGPSRGDGDHSGSSHSVGGPGISGLFSQTFSSNPMDNLLEDSDSEEEAENSGVEKDFSGATLRYLTDEEFLNQLDNRGLSDFTIYSSCVDDDNDDDNDDDDDDDDDEITPMTPGGDGHNYSQDLFLTPADQIRKKRSKLTIRKAVRDRLKTSHRSRIKQRKISAGDLQKQLLRAYENYVIYPDNTAAVTHKSYEWLLTVLSAYVECSVDVLHSSVQRTQLLLFDQETHSMHKGYRIMRWLYLNTFFQHRDKKRKRDESEGEGEDEMSVSVMF